MFLKRKNKFIINHETLIVLAIITIITFFAILAGNISDSRTATTKSHSIGEIVDVKSSYSVVVDKATFNNDVATKIHLPSSKKVLVIHFKVINRSNKKLSYLPMVHNYLRNDRGESFEFTPGLTDQTMQAEIIEPGSEVSGDLSFIVDSQYMPLWFYYDSKFDNQGPISFNIVK